LAGSTRRSFFTDLTPSTFFAISSAFAFLSTESTWPLSVTTPLSLSRLRLVTVPIPTSEASAG
jgi:hypothetical protein